MQLTSTVEMSPEIEQAVVKVARFHGWQDRMCAIALRKSHPLSL
jgi:hypothetical protein